MRHSAKHALTKTMVHQIKSEIKHLYREYDHHLDRIVKLDELLAKENIRARQCIQQLDKYAKDLALIG